MESKVPEYYVSRTTENYAAKSKPKKSCDPAVATFQDESLCLCSITLSVLRLQGHRKQRVKSPLEHIPVVWDFDGR